MCEVSQFARPSGAGDCGATTALTWIRCEDKPDDGLIYGTASGLVICWREVLGCSTVSGTKISILTLTNHLKLLGRVTKNLFVQS